MENGESMMKRYLFRFPSLRFPAFVFSVSSGLVRVFYSWEGLDGSNLRRWNAGLDRGPQKLTKTRQTRSLPTHKYQGWKE